MSKFVTKLVDNIKAKNFSATIELIEKMSDVDISIISDGLYNNRSKYSKPDDAPVIIKILSDYLDKATRTIQPKITCLAMIADIMVSIN